MFLIEKYLNKFFILKANRGIIATVVWILFTAALLGHSYPVYAIQISDDPMETQVQSGSANIMFVLDNSGSMDWEFMTAAADGKFEGSIEYLFNDPGDNNYSTASSNGTILTGANRGKWKSQWSGYNKIFYNAEAVYLPWPQTDSNQFTNADTSNPRSNPVYPTPVFDLTAEYYSVEGFAEAVVVDNTDAGRPRKL